MTLQEFSEIFAVLAVQLRQMDADEVTIRAYYKGLQELETEFVAMAAIEFAAHAEWFPKTSEWREAAVKIENARIEEQRARLRKLPTPLCLSCSDTGWDHTEDDRVKPCECRKLRRLEILGRRPWPALQPAPKVLVPIDAEKIAQTLAGSKGLK